MRTKGPYLDEPVVPTSAKLDNVVPINALMSTPGIIPNPPKKKSLTFIEVSPRR